MKTISTIKAAATLLCAATLAAGFTACNDDEDFTTEESQQIVINNEIYGSWYNTEEFKDEADSGDPNHKKILGELNFTGGAYDEYQGIKLAFAFSGATSEEDLVVARHGIEMMKGYLAEK